MLIAGLAAANRPGASMKSNAVHGRVQTAVAAKARELGVRYQSVTPGVMKHLRQVEAGLAIGVTSAQEAKAKLLSPSALIRKDRTERGLPPGKYKNGPRPKPPGLQKGNSRTGSGIDGRLETQRRITEIIKRIGLGQTPNQITRWAQETWNTGTSQRNVNDYIRAARIVLRENWARDREDFQVDLLEQYQMLAQEARAAEQMGTALGCLNSMARLCAIGGFAGQAPN